MPKVSSSLTSRRMKILLWGGWATRKTETILRYFPNVYIIDVEGNIDQVVGAQEIPEFLFDQTKDVNEIIGLLDQVAAGKIKMPNGQPVQTIAIDTVSLLWQVRQEVGALAAEKRAAKNNHSQDDANMTMKDWGTAKRPLKRLMTRLANMPVPFLILAAREKDMYVPKAGGRADEVVKVGVETDAMRGILYDVNVSFHMQKDAEGKWFADVDKVQGALGVILPLGKRCTKFPAKELLDYASKTVAAGTIQDDAELAEQELKQEEVKRVPPKKDSDLVAWAKQTYAMSGREVGAALAEAKTRFDPNRWDDMQAAVTSYHTKNKAG